LYIIEWKVEDEIYVNRALATLHQIDRAVMTSPEAVEDIEFSFLVTDLPDAPVVAKTAGSKTAGSKAVDLKADGAVAELVPEPHHLWTFTRSATKTASWLMPDFSYWAWSLAVIGTYEAIRMEMAATEPKWEDKIRMALWRGNKNKNQLRNDLLTATRDKEWADVESIKWINRTHAQEGSIGGSISVVDHCAYEFLIDAEGQSWSGRGKYLLNCNSVLITPEREWVEPHYHLFVNSGPEQNVVEVARDFSDLETKVQELLDDAERSRRIAQNSIKVFRDRYLTPAAQACYWRRLFQAWAEVSPELDAWHIVDGKKRLRGVPFETLM
jgi:hypothetical protein